MKKSIHFTGPAAASSQPACADDRLTLVGQVTTRKRASSSYPGRYRVLAGAACLWTLLLAAGGRVQADSTPFTNWSYTLAISPNDGSGNLTQQLTLAPQNNTNDSVRIRLGNPGTGTTAPVPVAQIFTTFSNTAGPDQYNQTFNLSVNLTDNTPGHNSQSVPVNFTGTLSGNVSNSTPTNPLQLTLTPVGNSGATLPVGQHLYAVTFDPIGSLGNATLSPTQINASITASNLPSSGPGSGTGGGNSGGGNSGGNSGGVQHTPEPSGLVLAGLAASLAGLRSWRRRRPAE